MTTFLLHAFMAAAILATGCLVSAVTNGDPTFGFVALLVVQTVLHARTERWNEPDDGDATHA